MFVSLPATLPRLQHSPSPHVHLFRLPGERDIDTATLIKMYVANYSRSGRGRSIRNCNLSLAQINTNLINRKESVKRTRSKHTCLVPCASCLMPRRTAAPSNAISGTLQLTASASVGAEREKNLLTFHQLQLATAQLAAEQLLGHAVCCQQVQWSKDCKSNCIYSYRAEPV